MVRLPSIGPSRRTTLRWSTLRWTSLAWVASLALHGAAGGALFAISGDRPRRLEADRVIKVAIEERERPPAPKRVAASPPPKEAKAEPERPRRPRIVKRRPAAAPPPNAAAREPPKARTVKPVFGVSMGSTVGSGAGIAVPVGNTVAVDPAVARGKPTEAAPYQAPPTMPKQPPAPRSVPSHRLTRMPRVERLHEAKYPEAARRAGIEGDVVLRLLIDARGRVRKVQLIKGLGHGLDARAVAAARRFRFAPARIGDEPVATTIPFTYRWEIED